MISTQEQYLIQKLKTGDKGAFEDFYNIYWRDLYASACRMTGSSEDAEEIVQDIFVDLWSKREAIPISISIKGYLYKMLKYKLIDKIRKNKLHEKYAAHIAAEVQLARTESAEQGMISRENIYGIHNSTKLLPEKCRQVFMLRRVENYSIREISEHLSISPQTVKNHLHKAFGIMRPVYEKVLTSLLAIFPLFWSCIPS
jgi:RNA polymerase sigma-70 factor, ECF subfamily